MVQLPGTKHPEIDTELEMCSALATELVCFREDAADIIIRAHWESSCHLGRLGQWAVVIKVHCGYPRGPIAGTPPSVPEPC